MKLYLFKADSRWVLTEIAQHASETARCNFASFSSFSTAMIGIYVWLGTGKYGSHLKRSIAASRRRLNRTMSGPCRV